MNGTTHQPTAVKHAPNLPAIFMAGFLLIRQMLSAMLAPGDEHLPGKTIQQNGADPVCSC
jgi:hypothetical protein